MNNVHAGDNNNRRADTISVAGRTELGISFRGDWFRR
jgi:hypothetical protein